MHIGLFKYLLIINYLSIKKLKPDTLIRYFSKVIKIYDKEFVDAFGENLKKIRKAKGLTQNQLAEKAGVDRSQVLRTEKGLQNASISTVFAFSKALKVPIRELFDFEFSEKK